MAGVNIVLTYEDYLALPNDGRRYEILDGELSVTPAPGPVHGTAPSFGVALGRLTPETYGGGTSTKLSQLVRLRGARDALRSARSAAAGR
jgi:hypothetical protein